MADSSLQILISAIDEASAPLRAIQDQIEQLQKTKSTTDRLNDLSSTLTNVGTKMSLFATAPIVAGLGLATKTAMDFESAMADLNKAAGFEAMSEESQHAAQVVKDLAIELGSMPQDIATIGTEALKLGVPFDQFEDYTKLVSSAAVAFDMTAADAGSSIGVLTNVLGYMDAQGRVNLQGLEQLSDTINYFADSTATSESAIVNVLQRAGGTTRTFGLANESAASLAAAFLNLGYPPEVVGTALNSMLPSFQNATQQTSKFQDALEQIGLPAAEFEQMIKQDAAGAVNTLIDAIAESGDTSIVSRLLGTGSDAAMLTSAIQNAERFKKVFNDISNVDAGSTMATFASRSATTEAQLGKLRATLSVIAIEVGSALLPAFVQIAGSLQPLAESFARFAQAHPGIVKIGIAFAMLVAAIGPVLVILGQFIGLMASVTAAGGMVAIITGFFSSLGAAIAVVGGAIASVFGGILSVITGVIAPVAALAAGLLAIPYAIFSVGAAMAGVSFTFSEFITVIKNSLMELPANLAALPEAISVIMGAAWLAIQTTVMNIITSVRMVFMQIATAASSVVTTIQASWAGLTAFFSGMWAAILAAVTGAIAGIVGAIVGGAAQAVSAVVSMGAQILGAVAGIAGQMFSAGANIVQSLAQGIMSAIGAVTSAASAVAGAIAAVVPGSPVQTGPLTVLNHGYAGNQIVEMLTGGIQAGLPTLQAMLSTGMPTPQLTPAVASASPGGGSAPVTITINVSGAGDPQATGQAVMEQIKQYLPRVQEQQSRDKARVSYGT